MHPKKLAVVAKGATQKLAVVAKVANQKKHVHSKIHQTATLVQLNATQPNQTMKDSMKDFINH
jgi:hypothetical protein